MTGILAAPLPTFGGTEIMTKPAHTTPPPDAAARRRSLPVLTYAVAQLPSFDASFYNKARAELAKVAELTVSPRDAKAFEVAAGHFFRIVSVEGPQVGDLNLWNAHDLTERFYSYAVSTPWAPAGRVTWLVPSRFHPAPMALPKRTGPENAPGRSAKSRQADHRRHRQSSSMYQARPFARGQPLAA